MLPQPERIGFSQLWAQTAGGDLVPLAYDESRYTLSIAFWEMPPNQDLAANMELLGT